MVKQTKKVRTRKKITKRAPPKTPVKKGREAFVVFVGGQRNEFHRAAWISPTYVDFLTRNPDMKPAEALRRSYEAWVLFSEEFVE